jgi:hypothetical protein
VNDPDGVQWEVYYFHADVEFNDPHYEMETASACCVAPAATDTMENKMVALPVVAAVTQGSGCCQ